MTVALYKNSVLQSLSCTTAATAPSTCSDTNAGHAVTVGTADTVAIGIKLASSGTIGDVTFTVEFDPS